ncbi:hypothetical protein EJ04DRAFT_296397 [Polyplosphaeria fusca]|uniref:Uncharacterized protein n=1 Tax=Polyplosphaeria fusca TaxID=682080 RepID=A0A9P4QV57_9PLEO|nr:hypothetical protein EJ04DRAFT_296397 [Polyplosphaeria fusca]
MESYEAERKKATFAEKDRDYFKGQLVGCESALNHARQEIQSLRSSEIAWGAEKHELNHLRVEYPKLRGECEELKRRESNWGQHKSRMLQNFEVERQQLLSKHAEELARSRVELQRTRDNYQKELADAVSIHKQQIEAERRIADKRNQAVEREMATRVTDVERELFAVTFKLEEELGVESRRCEQVEGMQAEIQQLNKAREADKAQYAKDLRDQETVLIKEHQRLTRDLRESYESLKHDYLKMGRETTNAEAAEPAELRQKSRTVASDHEEDLAVEVRKLKQVEDSLPTKVDRLNKAHARTDATTDATTDTKTATVRAATLKRAKRLKHEFTNRQQERTETGKRDTHVQSLQTPMKDNGKETRELEEASKSPKFDPPNNQKIIYRGIADHKLAARLKRLANPIEQFSKIQWVPTKPWPVKKDQLAAYSPSNTTKLQHQIVLNSVWVTLCNKVFSSPFAIVGEEGEIIHTQWLNAFDASKTVKDPEFKTQWPKPTPESEKSRYGSAKALYDAIHQTGTLSDLDKKRIEGFEMSVAAIATDISTTIANVASIGSKEVETIRDIVDISGRIWLEMCSQPYRITLKTAPEGGTDILSSAKLTARLTLIIRPCFYRCGNGQGQDLDNDSKVLGWQEKEVVYERSKVDSS